MFCQMWWQKIRKSLIGWPLSSVFFFFKHYDMHYFFSVKQNVKYIFIDGHRRKEHQKESDISKSIEKVKLLKLLRN